MKTARLAALKFFALLFLLPGLAGLIVSAMISTHYLDTMPRWPAPEINRLCRAEFMAPPCTKPLPKTAIST